MLRTPAPLTGDVRRQLVMDIPSDLQLMAQMAITLAGFTALVDASQRRNGQRLSLRERLHLGLIVQTAAFVVALGFVPSILSSLPIVPAAVWRLSIVAMAVAHSISWVYGWNTRMFTVLKAEVDGWERFVGLLSLPFGVVAVVAEVVIALGYYEQYTVFIYKSGLLLFLLVGLYSFVSLLLNRE